MGPPARVAASDAVRSALSAAKRSRSKTGSESAAPRERTDGAETKKFERGSEPSDDS
jgi:hypothetical protein